MKLINAILIISLIIAFAWWSDLVPRKIVDTGLVSECARFIVWLLGVSVALVVGRTVSEKLSNLFKS